MKQKVLKVLGVMLLMIIVVAIASRIIHFLAMKFLTEVGAFSFFRDPYLVFIVVLSLVIPVFSLLFSPKQEKSQDDKQENKKMVKGG